MRSYLTEARHHGERIQYYHRHAGVKGYKQAEYHYERLGQLSLSAERSKSGKNDAIRISILRESASESMEEMRKCAAHAPDADMD